MDCTSEAPIALHGFLNNVEKQFLQGYLCCRSLMVERVSQLNALHKYNSGSI